MKIFDDIIKVNREILLEYHTTSNNEFIPRKYNLCYMKL